MKQAILATLVLLTIAGSAQAQPAVKPSNAELSNRPEAAARTAKANSANGGSFDMSRFNAKGDGVTDDGPAIRKAVETVLQAGPGSVLSFPKRTYRLGNPDGKDFHIALEEAQGVTIDGNGSTLLLHPKAGAFSLERCRNVTVRGFVIEYDPAPFTQGTIRKVDAAKGAFTLEIQGGYPAPPPDEEVKKSRGQAGWRWGVVFDPKERHRRWDVTDHFFIDAIDAVAGQPGFFEFKVGAVDAKNLAPVRPGDRFFMPLMLMDGVRTDGMNFRITESSDCLIEDITFHSGRNGMVFGVSRNEGRITLRGARIEFKPGTANLVTTWRDGMHCKDNRIGPWIENCHFEGMQDDSINISANTAMARKQVSPTEFILTRTAFGPGDQVMVFDPVAGRTLAETKVVTAHAESEILHRVTLADAIPQVVTGNMTPKKDIRSTHFYNMSYANEKFVVRNCVFLPQRRHAILARCRGGVIEGNTVDSVGGAAVWMGNEIGSFYEGPFPRDNVIRNNTIRDTRLTPITITSHLLNAQARPTRNIRIENNTIRVLPDLPGICVQSAENIEIVGNQIRDSGDKPLGEDGVDVRNSVGVRISTEAVEILQ